jgi:cytochrome c peroxidase
MHAMISTPGAMFPRAGGLFWDGRKTNMEEAVIEPIFNHIEMGLKALDELPRKLEQQPYYAPLFKTAFATTEINMWRIQSSLSSFVAAMRTTSSKFKLSEKGGAALNSSESLGRILFIEKYNCSSCHQGQLGLQTPHEYEFQAEFANIGLSSNTTDRGLSMTTALAGDDGLFRVPSLNNVGLTAPYMHDGSIASLEEVIDHYSHSIQPHRNLDARLKENDGTPMRMDISAEEKKAIIDFLLTFTDNSIAKDQWLSDPFKIINK